MLKLKLWSSSLTLLNWSLSSPSLVTVSRRLASVIDAGLGIGHHPHRFNERLFYIERGQLDHDDALNDIQGHMDEVIELIRDGRIDPKVIISHRLPLDEGPKGYELFDSKEALKVVLDPRA